MLDLMLRVLSETWKILEEASIFLLFGFILAGALAVLVPKPALVRLFGRGKVRSVLWACAVGAPLPLCSCGVIPAALGLRREGATKGATVSFLISTPETGVDSIAVTYALMDPLIGTVRPVTAVATAITAGLTTNFLDPGANQTPPHIEPPDSAPHHAGIAHAGHQHSHLPGETAHAGCDHVHEDGAFVHVGRPRPYDAARQIYQYAFRDLLDETSYWLILAIVLSGLIAALVPPDLFDRYLSNDFAAMLVMLFIGIPMYTCASASTPLAAAMVMKGLNPGAALVFLLAGPATSAGSIVVLLKFLGARTVAIYLTSIAVVALLAGTLLDWLYGFMDLDPRATFGAATSFLPAPVKTLGALIVVALLVSSIRRTSPPGEWVGLCRKVAALSGNRLTWRRLGWVASGTIAVLYLGSGLITVGPGEVALRQRFGRILEPELGPGLHYRLPWPLETHEFVATQLVRRLEFGLRDDAPQQLEETTLARSRLTIGGPSNPAPEPLRARAVWFQNKAGVQDSFLLTGDANLVDLRFAVQYRVKSAVQFVLAAGDPEALLRSVVAVALRDAVATTGIDEIYTRSRGELERRVGVAVQRALDRYRSGIDLLAVRFLYVHAPEEVHDAFRDVASAQEDKLRTINRAGTFAVEKVNEAKAEAAATLEEALAFAEERRLRARGDADGFGLKAAAYRHRPELTRFRLHLEEAERALAGPNKVIRPGRGELESFEMWLASPSAPVERR